jgi:hypothetical protein
MRELQAEAQYAKHFLFIPEAASLFFRAGLTLKKVISKGSFSTSISTGGFLCGSCGSRPGIAMSSWLIKQHLLIFFDLNNDIIMGIYRCF